MTVKRKLAAILSADVAGYSRLMAEDEVDTLRSLNEARTVFKNLVERHGGRIIDTAGDSVLSEFGSPVAAVMCSVELQHQLAQRNEQVPEHRRMLFRLGLNLGDVIEDGGALYGGGVNVAARLQELAEPGGLCISASVFDQVEATSGASFIYAGEQHVKNIPRPVRVYRWSGGKAVASVGPLAMPSGVVVAVLPFTNLSSGADDYFADGLTEDVITELARFRDLYVLARNTTFQFKGKAVDVRSIGQKLGAQYVLEGSVRKAGERVRINAQLIEVATGAHVWAERFDRELADVFAIQDEITGKIVGAIAGGHLSVLPSAVRAAAQRKRTTDLTAYDLVLRATERAPWSSSAAYAESKALLKQAMERDPGYARPRHEYAWLVLIGWIFRLEDQPRPPEEVKRNAIESVKLDPADALAHRTAAAGYFFDGQLDLFERELSLALELAPHNAEVLAQLGLEVTATGQWERGRALVEKAYALNEASAGVWGYYSALHYYYYQRKEYRKAVEIVRQHPHQDLVENRWKYIAAYGQLGDLKRAQEYWQKCLMDIPEFSSDWVLTTLRLWNFPEPFLAHYMEGFAKAGFPCTFVS